MIKIKNIPLSTIVVILYALLVLWNEFYGNPYGMILGWGGLIVGLVFILEAIFR